VHFDRDPKKRRVDVDLSVAASYLDRIRADSVARVTSKGLLGDAIIDISVGSPDQPALKNGDPIQSAEPAGLAQIFDGLASTIRRVEILAGDVDARIVELFSPQVATDFGRILHSTAAVAEGVERGKGLAHTLIYEPTLASDTAQIVSDLKGSVGEVDRMLTDVRAGKGLLHQLIYDPKAGETVTALRNVASNLDSVVAEVKSGRGMIHSLVYEEDKKNLIRDLSETASIVRRLAEATEQGKGTVGGLLVDPTIYEDLLTIVGNVKRNSLVKALVRATIVNDNLDTHGRVEPQGEPKGDDVKPPPAPPASP
jgi:phospholipid/cholesterol/gamma-HCH transport system substrate-binding protein